MLRRIDFIAFLVIVLLGTYISIVISPGFSQGKAAIVLRAAHMFDGNRMTSPGIIVVSGQNIVATGANAPIPSGAEIIDFGNATLSAGFIDAHTHLSELTFTGDVRQRALDFLQKTVPERALLAAENLRKTLMAGITTVRDLNARDFIDVGLRNASRAGAISGPRMLVSVHAIAATGGQCDFQNGYRSGLFGHESSPEEGVINGPDEARRAVRFNVKYGADVIKACSSGGALSDDADTPYLTQEELNAIVDEAHTLGRRTAAHAHGAEAAKRAIRAGIDSVEHGTFLDDEALDLMKSRGTVLIPTLITRVTRERLDRPANQQSADNPRGKAALESSKQVMKSALAKGVRIGMGTDAGVSPHGNNPEEFSLLVEFGMKPLDALRAGTSVNADLLGLQKRIGTLEPGKLADIVAMPGDPTEDIRQTNKVFFVMKEGVIFKNEIAPTTLNRK
jgi:imidazolonepropionase-like amidohydrolase